MPWTSEDPPVKAFIEAALNELRNAQWKHPVPIRSLHEAASIIREEYEEFWDAVKEDDPFESFYEELVQIAVTALRTACDLGILSRQQKRRSL